MRSTLLLSYTILLDTTCPLTHNRHTLFYFTRIMPTIKKKTFLISLFFVLTLSFIFVSSFSLFTSRSFFPPLLFFNHSRTFSQFIFPFVLLPIFLFFIFLSQYFFNHTLVLTSHLIFIHLFCCQWYKSYKLLILHETKTIIETFMVVSLIKLPRPCPIRREKHT